MAASNSVMIVNLVRTILSVTNGGKFPFSFMILFFLPPAH